ncbi:MAG: hypothetical protein ACKVPX_02190 [Myxococcaceae bacterium]
MPRVILDGALSEQLAGYALIEKDLKNAGRWVERIKALVKPETFGKRVNYIYGGDRETLDVVKAFFVASLTFYAKAFTQCEGRRAQLNRSMLKTELRDMHDLYMRYRNSFAAHSEREKIEHARTVLLLHPKKSKNIQLWLLNSRLQPDFVLPGPGDPGLAELIDDAIRAVNERHDNLSRKIMEEQVLPKGPDYWYRKAK